MKRKRLRKQPTANKVKSAKREYILLLSQAFYHAISEAIKERCNDSNRIHTELL